MLKLTLDFDPSAHAGESV